MKLDPMSESDPVSESNPVSEHASGPWAHPRQHELLLEAALAGDVDPLDPRLVERLARCAECRSLHAELVATRGLLDQAGRDEREILATLDRQRVVPGSERVAPLLRALAAERPHLALVAEDRAPVAGEAALDGEPALDSELIEAPLPNPLHALPLHALPRGPKRTFSRPLIVGVASAAAGIVAVGWFVHSLLPQQPEETRETVLGSETDSGMSPSGAVREYTPLSWKLGLPPGGRFELTVWDDRPDAAPEPLVKPELWYRNERFFPPEQTRLWPDRIRWRVRVIDASGTQIDERIEHAQRLPR